MDFDQLEVLCGKIGIKIPEFYQLTPRQFSNYLKGFQEQKEAEVKLQFELNRDLEYAFLSPYFDKKQNIKSAKDYKTFVWETVQDTEVRVFKTAEELNAIWQKVDAEKEQL